MNAACRIQADSIIVSSHELLTPGQIVISRGRIVEVTKRTDVRADAYLDNCVLLPGLINPHTHLEFSDLQRPLPTGRDFPEWIQNVLKYRNGSTTPATSQADAVTAGLSESRAVGVVALGDIVATPWQPHLIQGQLSTSEPKVEGILDTEQLAWIKPHVCDGDNLPQVIAFIEQLGLSAQRRVSLTAWRDQLLNTARDTWPNRLIDMALSPHASYSTPPELWRELARLAARKNSLLAMHLLESPAEREWLDRGTGPMAEMLAQFGASGWRLPFDFVDQLCQSLSQSKSTLLIHGNYMTETELDCVARTNNMSIVYCPRTHAYFGHKPYPLVAIQQRGIRLLLGTDSRSTNPDLNLWQEARTALHLHPSLRPTQAFSAVTDTAAEALGLQNDFGSLQPGRRAAMNCIRFRKTIDHTLDQLLEHLFETASHPTLIM